MSARLPTLPGCVHGIVSKNPWGVQCDDCLHVFTDKHLILAVGQVSFNRYVPGTRKCKDCWRAAGWVYTYDGWKRADR